MAHAVGERPHARIGMGHAMGALAPLNLLVILNTHVPEVLGETQFQQAKDPEQFSADAKNHKLSEDEAANLSLQASAEPFKSLAKQKSAWEGDEDVQSRSTHGGLGAAARCPGGPNARCPESVHTKDPDIGAQGHQPGGLSIGGSTSSSQKASPTCTCSCPGMVQVPRDIFEQTELKAILQATDARAELERRRQQEKAKHITLVMSRDNIAALAVISVLSVFGAIYLWKICTRKRCSCRICTGKYRTGQLLGAGGYGSVYLVDRVSDGQRFVSKRILVRDITEVDEYSLEAKELVTLRHKHIVSYEEDFVHVEYGTLETKTYFMIIMEFCPEGDLKEKIEADFCSFTEHYVRTIFAQLLDAVQYLHSKNVIHRDLKSQNVFLAHDGRVRLGDFGLCKHTRTEVGQPSLTHAGTDCYMAPEMLSSSKYGKPADMWSLGCVLYELVTGQFMWELDGILGAMVMKDSHTVQKLLKENLVPCVGNALPSLLKRLLSIHPTARPTITTCIRKKLFKPSFPLSRMTFGECLGETEAQDSTPSPSSSQLLRVSSKNSGLDFGDTVQSSSDEESSKSEAEQADATIPKRKRRPRKKASKGSGRPRRGP